MTITAAADALRPLPAGYHELYGKVLAAATADERIRAMWLGGSLGRGVADAGSDLDVVLAVAPGALEEFAANWRDWLASVTPTVLARELPRHPGSWYSLTPSCLRLDVICEPAGAAPLAALARRLLVLDKDSAYDQPAREPAAAADGTAPRGPDPERLAGLAAEFLRQQAIFPAAVVAREDWLLGVVGVQGVHQMLYDLFVESNQPLPPMGVKQWSAKLTAEQRQACAALPAPSANRQSVVGAMRAARAAFLPAARRILAANQVAWPAELDRAVQDYLAAELGWTE